MALSLSFLLRADAEQAHESIEKIEAATQRATAAIEGNFAEASEGIVSKLGTIAPVVGIASAAVVGLSTAILGLAHHSAEYGESIYTAAVKTGLSSTQLSGLAAVSKQTGENFDSLVVALGRAQRNLGIALADPTAITSKALIQLGGGAEHLKEIISEPGGTGEAIQMLLNRIFALQNPIERNVELQALLGRGWMSNTKTLQFLAKEGFEEATKKAVAFGMSVDDKQVAQAHVFVEEMDKLKAELEGIALSLGQWLIPKLQEFEIGLVGAAKLGEAFGLVLKAVGADMRLHVSEAGQYLIDAYKKIGEVVPAELEAMKKQQEQINEALTNMHDPAARASIDLANLKDKTKTLSEAEIEAAERVALAAAARRGYNEWLKVSEDIHKRILNVMANSRTELEYERKVMEEMIKQSERLAEARANAKKPAEAPEFKGPTPLDEESLKKTREALDQLTAATQKQSPFTSEAARAMEEYRQSLADTHEPLQRMGVEIAKMVQLHQQGLPTIIAFTHAMGEEGKVSEEAAKKQIAAQAQTLLSHIISRKAMAIIETVVQSAEGFASLAARDFWGAAQHFISAAEWGIVAGKSGGKSGGGGGSKGPEEEAGSRGLPGVVGSSREGGGSGTQHQTIVHIYGGQITDTHNLQNLAAALNSGGGSGVIRLNTSGTSATIPAPAA